MERRIFLSFNHEAEGLKEAVLVNGRSAIPSKPPEEEIAFETIDFLETTCNTVRFFNTMDLARIILYKYEHDTNEELALRAFICGLAIVDLNEKIRLNGMKLILSEKKPASEIIENIAGETLKALLPDARITHEDIGLIANIVGILTLGSICGILNDKMRFMMDLMKLRGDDPNLDPCKGCHGCDDE